MIAWVLVMGLAAGAGITGLVGEVTAWEEVTQHVEVIPFYLGSSTHTYDHFPVRERSLTVLSGPVSLQYHLIAPDSLPQYDYASAFRALPSPNEAEVLQQFVGSLQWQQSAYFVFLIYDPDRSPSDSCGYIKRENFTYNVVATDTQLKNELLIVHLAYTDVIGLSNIHKLFLPVYLLLSIESVLSSDAGRVIARYRDAVLSIKSALDPVLSTDEHVQVLFPHTHEQLTAECSSLLKDVSSAQMYLGQRKYTKAAKYIVAVENSQSLLRLLNTRANVGELYGISGFFVCVLAGYGVILLGFFRESKGSSKAQV